MRRRKAVTIERALLALLAAGALGAQQTAAGAAGEGEAERARLAMKALQAGLISAIESARRAYIFIGDRQWGIQPASDVDPEADPATHVVYLNEDILPGDWGCGTDFLKPNRFEVAPARLNAVSAASGTDWLDRSRSALLIDLDNDGDADLVVCVGPAIVLMENDGSGKFTQKAKLGTETEMITMNIMR